MKALPTELQGEKIDRLPSPRLSVQHVSTTVLITKTATIEHYDVLICAAGSETLQSNLGFYVFFDTVDTVENTLDTRMKIWWLPRRTRYSAIEAAHFLYYGGP